jgi:hypothetical protein
MERRPLWAPWRIEYIKGAKPDECIFCAASRTDDDAAAGSSIAAIGASRCSMRSRTPEGT